MRGCRLLLSGSGLFGVRPLTRSFGKGKAPGNMQFLNKLGLSAADLHTTPNSAETSRVEAQQKLVTHVPVMLNEVTEMVKKQVITLKKEKGNSPIYMVDCCVGTGGHALHLLKNIPELVIAGLDWDPNMIRSLTERTKNLDFLKDEEGRNRLQLKHLNFSKLQTQTRQDLFPDYATGSRALKMKVDILLGG